MYKRRAHVLYLSNESGLLQLAERITGEYGAQWLECECLLMVSELSGCTPPAVTADLVIQIIRQGATRIEYKTDRPFRYWILGGEVAHMEQQIRTEIKSMLAGMKMLSRMDS